MAGCPNGATLDRSLRSDLVIEARGTRSGSWTGPCTGFDTAQK